MPAQSLTSEGSFACSALFLCVTLISCHLGAIAFSYPALLEGRAVSDAHRQGHWLLGGSVCVQQKDSSFSSFCVIALASRSWTACPLSPLCSTYCLYRQQPKPMGRVHQRQNHTPVRVLLLAPALTASVAWRYQEMQVSTICTIRLQGSTRKNSSLGLECENSSCLVCVF